MTWRPALSTALLLLVQACSSIDPQPVEPARGRGNADIPDTALPSARSSFFGPRERKPEQDLPAPGAPREENLREITLRNLTESHVALDRSTLTVGADDVVRYTLVVTSPQGARNVSFEGIRCDPNEWKLLALGRPDGTWGKPRDQEWQKIENRGYNAIRYTLAKEYFCDLNGAPMKDARSIFARMRQERALRDSRPD